MRKLPKEVKQTIWKSISAAYQLAVETSEESERINRRAKRTDRLPLPSSHMPWMYASAAMDYERQRIIDIFSPAAEILKRVRFDDLKKHMLGYHGSARPYGPNEALWDLLWELVVSGESIQHRNLRKRFGTEYSLWIKTINSDLFTLELVSPLWNFETDITSFRLDTNTVVKQLNNLQRSELMKVTDPTYITHRLVTFALVTSKEQVLVRDTTGKEQDLFTKSTNQFFEHLKWAQTEHQKWITKFRLYKEGGLHLMGTLLFCPNHYFRFRRSFFNPLPSKDRSKTPYRLLSKDRPIFNQWNKTIKTNQVRLELAMRWFSESYSSRVEDSILRLVVALEILYLPNVKQEKSYTLAHRVSVLLGETTSEKRYFFRLVRDAYSLRSSIVHEGTLKKRDFSKITGRDPEDFTIEVQDLVRLSIKKMVEFDPSLDIFKENSTWENLLFNNGD